MRDDLPLIQAPGGSSSGGRAHPQRELPAWSAAIANFNGEELVCETIASVKQLEYPPAEILLVDDGSTDASIERVRAEHPDVRIIGLGRNTGILNIVRNRGLREARHRYVLISDNDVVFAPDAVRHLLETLRERPDAAVCTPLVVAADDRQTLLTQGHEIHFLCWSTLMLTTTVHSARSLATRKAMGCGIQMVDKVRATAVGCFDEDLVLGWGDDGEFHFRLRLAGLACYSVPSAMVFHRRVRVKSRFYGQVHNRWHMMLKDYQWRTIVILTPALFIYEPLLALLLVAMGVGRDYGRALRDVARALPHILRQRRRVQAMRRVADRDILSADHLSAPRRLWELKTIRVGFSALSIGFRLYWALARPLLSWRPAEPLPSLPGRGVAVGTDGLASEPELGQPASGSSCRPPHAR